MRTVVLGGTRFIGRAVAEELVAAGHEVLVVYRGEHEAPYEKLDVERAYRARGGTVCRRWSTGARFQAARGLRAAAGARGAPQAAGGRRGFLWSRGHAPELARGMRIALETPAAAGEVFNLCEARCAPVLLWIEQILEAAELELARVPHALLPEDLDITADIAQHWTASPQRAERVLGWTHAEPGPCVRASVGWHLAHPSPQGEGDFGADDRAS